MEDERYFEVDGRRWRRTDPAIPERLRAELVAELMSARRAVGVALRAGDPDAEAQARARVGDAKVALGERGHPWWEPADAEALGTRAIAAARTLLRHRAPKTICPSDVARIVGGEQWRSQMTAVRAALNGEAERGELVLRQKGLDVADVHATKGPVRFAAGPRFPR